jgi:hypothetical protein
MPKIITVGIDSFIGKEYDRNNVERQKCIEIGEGSHMGFTQYPLQMATKEIGKIDRECDNQQIRQDKNNFCYKIFHTAEALTDIRSYFSEKSIVSR